MAQEISPEVYARALVAAESLKKTLEERLIGKTAHAWNCGCGACGAGPSKVVAIEMAGSRYPNQIALFTLWGCDMRDDKGKAWTRGITDYIPWAELYPMFRNHFAGIPVRVDRAHARLMLDRSDSDFASREGRQFVGSGRTVVVGDNSPAYVRPIGDLSKSIWVNAALRVDSNMPQYSNSKPLITCHVDSLEFGVMHGRGLGNYYELVDPARLPTFYVDIPGSSPNKLAFFPVARLVSRDEDRAEATFELDQAVESFSP
ncbi:MAG: hypothetical protein K2W82_17575 [Candidatus Obscuribacterales bacterium]|nr:hypothetical protein [Candidatus Obscuribacterales bacterium]